MAIVTSAVRATKDLSVLLDAMTDDSTTAMVALRRQGMDRAFEGVEGARSLGGSYLERLVVLVSAHVTGCHDQGLQFRVLISRDVPRWVTFPRAVKEL
jgi:hypothetical protein